MKYRVEFGIISLLGIEKDIMNKIRSQTKWNVNRLQIYWAIRDEIKNDIWNHFRDQYRITIHRHHHQIRDKLIGRNYGKY